jgi:thiol:disulfide interchange protein
VVKAKFKELNVVALQADQTNPDPVIAEFLFRNDLAAIPVYLIYPADPSRPPILLPDGLISQGDVLRGLEMAANK